jgi:NifU-like protein involved in Fe-S cluster formation
MAAQLYTTEILRLATSIPHLGRLDNPDATAERRSPVCGSRVTADVRMQEGLVADLGLDVSACALGQASASLVGADAIGHSVAELEGASAALTGWLAGERDSPGEWPGLTIFDAARNYPARHAAIRLAFEAVAEAARKAQG